MHERVLVVHTGGIGDFLMCCPSLQALARTFTVELLGRPERLALAIAGGVAERAHDIESVGFESLFTIPNAEIKSFLSRFDAAVVWMRDNAGLLERSVQSCGVKDVRVFPGLPPEDWTRHASEYYIDCLGLKTSEPFRLSFGRINRQFDIVLHPGSGSKNKNWPLSCFENLAKTLRTRGRRVQWCLGPAEEPFLLSEGIEALSEASLTALARHLASAHAYVGNDSGITHLAAACGTKTIAIFGPTDPAIWAPRGPNVRIVRGEPWPPVEAVLDALINE
ncbi:MAG: glycosyltransferase family 9 protein [Candidatus Hydrogenedentota bacterium]